MTLITSTNGINETNVKGNKIFKNRNRRRTQKLFLGNDEETVQRTEARVFESVNRRLTATGDTKLLPPVPTTLIFPNVLPETNVSSTTISIKPDSEISETSYKLPKITPSYIWPENITKHNRTKSWDKGSFDLEKVNNEKKNSFQFDHDATLSENEMQLTDNISEEATLCDSQKIYDHPAILASIAFCSYIGSLTCFSLAPIKPEAETFFSSTPEIPFLFPIIYFSVNAISVLFISSIANHKGFISTLRCFGCILRLLSIYEPWLSILGQLLTAISPGPPGLYDSMAASVFETGNALGLATSFVLGLTVHHRPQFVPIVLALVTCISLINVGTFYFILDPTADEINPWILSSWDIRDPDTPITAVSYVSLDEYQGFFTEFKQIVYDIMSLFENKSVLILILSIGFNFALRHGIIANIVTLLGRTASGAVTTLTGLTFVLAFAFPARTKLIKSLNDSFNYLLIATFSLLAIAFLFSKIQPLASIIFIGLLGGYAKCFSVGLISKQPLDTERLLLPIIELVSSLLSIILILVLQSGDTTGLVSVLCLTFSLFVTIAVT